MCLHSSLEWKVRDCIKIKVLPSVCFYFNTVLIPFMHTSETPPQSASRQLKKKKSHLTLSHSF